jgi:hypothetical protein
MPTAWAIDTGHSLDYVVIAPGTAGVSKLFAGYETDAELLFLRQQKESGHVIALEMHNGSRFCYQFQPLAVNRDSL